MPTSAVKDISLDGNIFFVIGADDQCTWPSTARPSSLQRIVSSRPFAVSSGCLVLLNGLFAALVAEIVPEAESAPTIASAMGFLQWVVLWELLIRFAARFPKPNLFFHSAWTVLDSVCGVASLALFCWGTAQVQLGDSSWFASQWTSTRWKWLAAPLAVRLARCWRCASRLSFSPLRHAAEATSEAMPLVLWAVGASLVPLYAIGCIGVLVISSREPTHWDSLSDGWLRLTQLLTPDPWLHWTVEPPDAAVVLFYCVIVIVLHVLSGVVAAAILYKCRASSPVSSLATAGRGCGWLDAAVSATAPDGWNHEEQNKHVLSTEGLSRGAQGHEQLVSRIEFVSHKLDLLDVAIRSFNDTSNTHCL